MHASRSICHIHQPNEPSEKIEVGTSLFAINVGDNKSQIKNRLQKEESIRQALTYHSYGRPHGHDVHRLRRSYGGPGLPRGLSRTSTGSLALVEEPTISDAGTVSRPLRQLVSKNQAATSIINYSPSTFFTWRDIIRGDD